jgi:ABC-2 type transport system ATP-binding protein
MLSFFCYSEIRMSTILKVKNLEKSYNGHKAVNGINFEVEKAEIFGILGPNGAGKTTTLEMIEALRPIDGGTVTIAGIDVASEPYKIRSLIGVQPQTAAFQDKTRLVELIELFASAYGERVDTSELLADVNLLEKANDYVESLSGGQRQRFSIATALVHGPKVFFMDEPTTGLDPQARHNLWSLVRKIQARGVSVVLTTHYMEEAEELCDRVAIMEKGDIVALDTPQNLVQQLLAKGFKKKQRVEQANLEDVFMDFTGRGLSDA